MAKIETLREIFVIELRITGDDGRSSIQLCGTSHTMENAEERLKKLPKPQGYEFSIVRYVPSVSAEGGK